MIIIGDGPYRKMLTDLANESDYGTKIKMLGRVGDELLTECYLREMVLVCPNIPVSGDIEGFGICNIEAAYLGVILISHSNFYS